MKSPRPKSAHTVSVFLIVICTSFTPVTHATSDDSGAQRDARFTSLIEKLSKVTVSSVYIKVDKTQPSSPTAPRSISRRLSPSAHRSKPLHGKTMAPRLPRSVRCLNQLTAHGGQDYIDRIVNGLNRKRFGVTPVSTQISRLTGEQRVAYDKCLKPTPKPKSKHKASKALLGKSVVTLLREQKEFTVPSAGMRIQPDGRHIPSKPAIIYATDIAPRTEDFVLGGRNLKIRFTPVKYEADLGDGGPVLEQAEAPMPYPDAFKGHFYRKFTHSGTFTVTMRTFWRVEWFNPATGVWVSEDQMLISEQKTQPQTVRPYNYLLTDDAEERHGQ